MLSHPAALKANAIDIMATVTLRTAASPEEYWRAGHGALTVEYQRAGIRA
jgi:hypothetical protein